MNFLGQHYEPKQQLKQQFYFIYTEIYSDRLPCCINKRKEYLQNCQCPHCENSIHVMSHLLERNYIMVKHADDRKANSMLSNGYITLLASSNPLNCYKPNLYFYKYIKLPLLKKQKNNLLYLLFV